MELFHKAAAAMETGGSFPLQIVIKFTKTGGSRPIPPKKAHALSLLLYEIERL